jgi:alpha-glucosidase
MAGEVCAATDRLMAYYGRDLAGLHLPFNSALLDAPWRARVLAKLIDEYEAALPTGAWPNWTFGNHDRPRIASRIGTAQARVAAMLLLTLRGTPTLYYGDEIGLPQVAIPPALAQDPFGKNVPGLGRDGCRTPMQWDGSVNAGFSTAAPWLPLSDDAATCNVAYERADPGSIYNLYRRLLALRRAHPALSTGDYRAVEMEGDVLAYLREGEGGRFLVALNFGTMPASLSLPAGERGTVAISAQPGREGETVAGRLDLGVNDGLVIALD